MAVWSGCLGGWFNSPLSVSDPSQHVHMNDVAWCGRPWQLNTMILMLTTSRALMVCPRAQSPVPLLSMLPVWNPLTLEPTRPAGWWHRRCRWPSDKTPKCRVCASNAPNTRTVLFSPRVVLAREDEGVGAKFDCFFSGDSNPSVTDLNL